jgi:hypothetical protein
VGRIGSSNLRRWTIRFLSVFSMIYYLRNLGDIPAPRPLWSLTMRWLGIYLMEAMRWMREQLDDMANQSAVNTECGCG